MLIDQFSAIPEVNLKGVAVYAKPKSNSVTKVTLDSAATEIMTDFYKTLAVTTESDVNIDDANAKMIAFGIRGLIVVNDKGQLEGVVTAADILGEKPMQILQQRGGRHTDITVADVMIPCDQLSFIHYNDLEKSKVGHVVQTLRRTRPQYTLVLEEQSGNEIVRGVISASQVARQLGVSFHPEVARTFAEIENVLVRS